MSEAFGPDFITVTDEDGNEFELELVDSLEYNGTTYHALFPAVEEDEETGEPKDIDADDEEYGLVIMKVVEENGGGAALHSGQRPGDGNHLQPVYGALLRRGRRITVDFR